MASPNTIKLRTPFRSVAVYPRRLAKVKRWFEETPLKKAVPARQLNRNRIKYYKAVHWLTREGYIKIKPPADKNERRAVRSFAKSLKR